MDLDSTNIYHMLTECQPSARAFTLFLKENNGKYQLDRVEYSCDTTIRRKYNHAAAKSHQSCPTLCDPIDGSPPSSPVPGILQVRTLEWVAISFSNA